MKLHYYSRYIAEYGGDKREVDWAAIWIKKWIKGESITRAFSVPTQGGKNLTFNPSDRERFLNILWKSMAHRLEKIIDKPHAIVPIPSHTTIVGGNNSYRTLEYARAIAAHSPKLLTAEDGFRWYQQRETQRQTSGRRDPQPRYQNLALNWRPDRPCIVLDDVCTSGSSLVAARWKLEDAGGGVPLAFVVSRPTHQQHDRMVGWFDEDAPTFPRSLFG